MSRANSIQFDMLKNALPSGRDFSSNTQKQYKNDIKVFASWCRENQGLRSVDSIQEAGVVDVIKTYCDCLCEKGYSPATIHTRLASVCRGLDVSMREIDNKPRRSSNTITRSRDDSKNTQGKVEAMEARFERVTSFQSVVGIRRTELYRLRGRDLIRDESGHLCVYVEKGKGGKAQAQRISEKDEDFVSSVMRSVAPGQHVFLKAELNNKIDFHALRAENAFSKYNEYLEKAKDPAYREELRKELVARYNACNENSSKTHRDRFMHEVFSDKPYRLRGDNKERAVQNGRPVEYDRLCVMAVSVFHLSHWRADVTVVNYLI